MHKVDLIYVGVNSIILHKLRYYNINKWHTKEWQTKEETEEISSLLADVNKEINCEMNCIERKTLIMRQEL